MLKVLGLFRHWPILLLASLLIGSAINGRKTEQPTVVSPEIDERLLDYVAESGERGKQIEERLSTIEQAALPTVQQQQADQKEIMTTLNEFRDFDKHAWGVFDAMILAKSWEMFDEADRLARENHHSIEWEIAAKATSVKDQLFALSNPQQGLISMADGPQRDQFSDVVTDALALSALMGQLMADSSPNRTEVNSKALVSASESLSSALYSTAYRNIPLRTVGLPQVKPFEEQQDEVQNASN
ncbi:MAG: hypothetical protein AAGD25_06600 [Cyanobacteria bacterium P01_F01_bin.150]